MKAEEVSLQELAQRYGDHISNEKGEVLARVWESAQFKEAFDYNGGYEKRGWLKRRLSNVQYNYDAAK